uniref:Putative secreted protein n=1 Tax=Anopheles marajoara TaxID=58244 RepID=A0A2M4CD67_9DIPT
MLVSTQLIVLRLLPFSTTVGGGRNFTAPGGTFLCGREMSSLFLPVESVGTGSSAFKVTLWRLLAETYRDSMFGA